ncbi:Arf-GAP with Rho-GAP domain, ANK repeat and PH domain-containing protein 2 [Cricetulus griseus]|uniref:Arf-GAP with Rho-GAP domain, ANK repeat and PH domain-containing protein 2 n=1 Tax=Cricetulus griseus TaxID=10029 RepID=G3I6M0_CRIGR|nr:Arf-GAP with Rho-GAP domain, ANK repeat and PH domain-containing protein 2 [Cricetulus griseus]
MSSVSEVNVDIRDFLMSINLEQYLVHFREFGFYTLKDCASINDSVLHQIGISPTGHRRRILKQLQMIFSKMQDIPIYANVHKTKNGNASKEHQNLPSSSNTTCVEFSDCISVHRPGLTPVEKVTMSTFGVGNCQSPKSHDKLSLPSEEELPQNVDSSQDSLFGSANVKIDSLITQKAVDCTDGEEQTEKVNLISENSRVAFSTNPESLPSVDYPTSETHSGSGTNGLLESSPASPFFQFQGEMVVNDLYVPSSPVHTPMRSRSKLVSRPSRSFLLRHRPVPEIPGSTKAISGSYFRDRRSATTSAGKSLTLKNSKEDNSTSIFPYGETFLFQRLESSKKRSIKNEFWAHEDTVKEDAVTTKNSISTKSRKRMFQKRWVKFDGLSISYYNNEREMYSKGIIPLTAISTVRAQGDNKFEIVTTQRTFVFRVEKEGQHRSLGPKDSKVRSLKMDASIWSNELIELFIVIGNKRANDFWAGNLQKDEELHMDSPVEKRKNFITQKYKEGKFRKTLLASLTKEELNKALCAAVVKPDVLETMTLLFSGADVMCATGDPVHSTPYLLAKKAGQSLQMEFLYHNKFSETNKKWCVLEGGFLSYYENDKCTTPNGTINISEVICLAVHKEDFYLNTGTLYIHGHTKLDFTVWHTAIEKAAGTDGNALQDQQLCKNDVPIIVNSCIAFVTQYGLGCKHIYQKNGDPSHISELLESFKKDARSVKLRAGKHQLEDVTSVLKSFLSDIDDALLTKELYPYWVSTLGNPHNQVSQAGDLLIEVYVERKEPDCSIIIRISPVMEAEELTNDILAIKNIVPSKGDIWATFEVIENEELERPLHYTENVLEQVLQWSSLAEPGSAYLVVKRFLTVDIIKHCREKSVKEGALKLKEEPSKILSGNKFQDRYIVLRDGHLFLYKDPKSSKHDKMFSLSLMKFYLGVKKKMKPPTR